MASGGGGQTAARTPRGGATLIIRAELQQSTSSDLWEAVNILRPRWLQTQRNASFAAPQAFARVVVNGTPRGALYELRRISASAIESMRFVSASDATTKYGTGYPGGAIEVTMRDRR